MQPLYLLSNLRFSFCQALLFPCSIITNELIVAKKASKLTKIVHVWIELLNERGLS